MDTLPPEILAHIVNSLPEFWYSRSKFGARLADYSSISRAWKASIERLTFRRLSITTDELDDFAALFSGEKISRWAYVTYVSVTFTLPVPQNDMGCCPVVQPPDREADSVAFSASVVKLFTILADLAARTTEKQPLSLGFDSAYRLSKFHSPNVTSFTRCKDPDRTHSRREVREAKAVSGQFELIQENIIPTLHSITTFASHTCYYLQDLKSTWIPGIVAKLPDLEILRLRTDDQYVDGRRKRMAQRECFAASIRSLEGNNLREMRLMIQHSPMENENVPVHKFVDNDQWSKETWFRMFNHLASLPNLAVLQLLGGLVICPEFFRGIVDHPGTPFPSLIEFEMQFSADTADGRWFYERDDEALERSRSDPEYDEFWEEEDEDDDDAEWSSNADSDGYVRVFEDEPFRTNVVGHKQFRSLPSTTTFLPFLMDASKAALRVPNLQKFILKLLGHGPTKSAYLDFPMVTRVFELWYLKAGMHRTRLDTVLPNPYVPRDAAYLNQVRLYWRVDGVKPWDEVQAAWGAIAGPDAKIVWLEEDQWTTHENNAFSDVYNGEF